MKAMFQIKTTGEVIALNAVDCTLEMAQEYVGGLIENAWTAGDNKLTMWCNEEGLLNGLEYNAIASGLCGGHIVGDCLLVENEKKDFE